MPIISVKKSILDREFQRNWTEKEFDELCFSYGLELDEVTSEAQELKKEQQNIENEKLKTLSTEILYKIEIPANRYDLLCAEGLCRALKIFQNGLQAPKYELTNPKKKLSLKIDPSTATVRPHCVCAVLRDISITPEAYASLIDLQDKLHHNIGRKRSLVAIGTHDLDTIQGPFQYHAKSPGEIKFKPLNQTKELTAPELMELYSTDSHLRHYLDIIRHEPLYPVIYDANGVVLSMPPIINGDRSKIKLGTKNIFIECTAKDLNKAIIVVDTIVLIFSQYCAKPFTIEPVEVVQPDGSICTYPKLEYWKTSIDATEINQKVGVDLKIDDLVKLLERMSFEVKTSENQLNVMVPPNRHDIIHNCDLIEDIAIAFGYNNIPVVIPPTTGFAEQLILSTLTDKLRLEMLAAGFTEALTFSLCSRNDISKSLRQGEDVLNKAIHIDNPKSLEFQVARTSLLPGILKTLHYNKNRPLPFKLFEIQDVVLIDESNDVGARNERHLCAVFCGKTSGFEIIHGVLDRIMQRLQVTFSKSGPKSYHIEKDDDPTFFDGRCAKVVGPNNEIVGRVGVLHPEVLTAFELTLPCSAVEINIEPLI